MAFPILPEAASSNATRTDNLYWGFCCLSAAVMLVIFVPMIFWIFKYRNSRPADRQPVHLPEIPMEVTWTVVPTLIMMCFFAWSAREYFNIERPPPNAMEIYVVAKQWMWKIQHPEGNREINELHVPEGRIVKLVMASQDVIHSFYVPAFRVKQDVVPGRYTTEWFKATRLGRFHLFCAEYCGTSHSHMIGTVVVMTPSDYQAWLARGAPGSTLVQTGERLFRNLGCSGCHVGSSIIHAPPLEGLYGKPVPLSDGQVVTADEAYLRDSILFPAKQIVGGYTNDMPTFEGHISEDQLVGLIAYLKAIGSQSPTKP